MPNTRRRQGLPLFVSGTLHATFLLALILFTTDLLTARDTEFNVPVELKPVRLVYFVSPGPGGGGGGGGLNMPELPPKVERRAPPKVVRRTSSPVPPRTPPRPVVPRPQPVVPQVVRPRAPDPPTPTPPAPDPPKAAEEPIQPAPKAPVAPVPADTRTQAGVLAKSPATAPSAGPGTGGGVGTGSGAGIGEGRGDGIGPGSGGGTGGGPFRPGSGIDPPQLQREVKPLYTEEARRQSLEGNVVLEVVVRRDGSVGNLRVIRRLGAGLDERALDAVRQWRFAPARRQGASVDVVVEVSVEFKLR